MRDPDTSKRRAAIPQPAILYLKHLGRLDVALDHALAGGAGGGSGLYRCPRAIDRGRHLAAGQNKTRREKQGCSGE
ncbi:MAG: hypothetical protein Kow0013_26280 [Pararhodobacter sp.]